jgi:hypothetical protein
MLRPTLTELANKYNTDKGTTYPCHHVHGYTEIYAQYLDPLRDEPINLLEIGVVLDGEGGASLRMWEEYFSVATITGFDIKPIAHLIAPRIRCYQGDMMSPTDLGKIEPREFDVIIDDGSHLQHHQISCFLEMFSRVKPGGIYIVEDLCVPGVDNSCHINNIAMVHFLEAVRTHTPHDVRFHLDMKDQFQVCVIRKIS